MLAFVASETTHSVNGGYSRNSYLAPPPEGVVAETRSTVYGGESSPSGVDAKTWAFLIRCDTFRQTWW